MLDAGNIFLVGPMGSGKSAVGRLLALRLGLEFVDSDAEIESRTGVDIPYIFEREGEAGFRQREREAQSESDRLRPGDPDNPDSFKTRRAKVGGYHDYFDAAQIAEIDAIVARSLDPSFRY